ncbi:MAG: hypothetical protein RIT01_617 [Pseudomonadota bacterium]|jgi:hypothetical protein
MVEVFGKYYYIDLDTVTEVCRTGNTIKDDDGGESLEINIFKYEIIKMCLERVLNEFDESDEEMGLFAQKDTTISFRLAFNTLVKNNILIEEENE